MEPTARIFVAGHTGLVGTAVVARLLADGATNVLTAPRSTLDLRDKARVDAFFAAERPEYVVLAAGRVGGIAENLAKPVQFLDDNLGIQLNVMAAAEACGVRRLIFFGSSCMYPRECAQPMREEQLLTGRPEITSLPYAMAKLAGVHGCLARNAQAGASRFVPVIPNSIYGPHDNFDPTSGHVLSSLMARFHDARQQGIDAVTLWGTGTPRREFVHVSDVADACLFLLGHEVAGDLLPLNIGVGSDVAIRELAEMIARVVGYEGEVRWDHSKPDGAPRKLLDVRRMSALGWNAKVTLEAGLRDLYAWYQAQRGSSNSDGS